MNRTERGDGLVGVATAVGEITREQVVLLGDVARADADDEAAAGEEVER